MFTWQSGLRAQCWRGRVFKHRRKDVPAPVSQSLSLTRPACALNDVRQYSTLKNSWYVDVLISIECVISSRQECWRLDICMTQKTKHSKEWRQTFTFRAALLLLFFDSSTTCQSGMLVMANFTSCEAFQLIYFWLWSYVPQPMAKNRQVLQCTNLYSTVL